MARRVNTKFVVVLGGVLFVGAGTVLAFMGRNAWHNRDPEYLKKQGDDALAAKDLPNAVRFYARAADQASKSHREGTDELYTKLGDLEMQLSAQTADSLESAKLYGGAQDAWKRALTENAGYVPAREKLIEEQYKIATYESRPEAWTALEETASKLTVLDKSYGKAFTYLAAARYYLLQSAATMGVDVKKAMAVEDDIQRAMKADPTSPMPAVLRASLLQLEAIQLPRSSAKEARRLFDEALAGLQAFLTKNPNDPEASMAAARIHWGLKERDEALKGLEAAVAAHPQDVRMASLLSSCYSEQRLFDQAEKVLTNVAAAAPTDPEAQLALARYYQAVHKPTEAIAAFGKVLELPQSGGGIAAAMNIRRQVDSLFNISWLSMDLVEEKRRLRATAEAKTALDQATLYFNKLRTAPSVRSSQDLLEGRLQMLAGNYSGAVNKLKLADAEFSKSPSSPQWLETKATLSQAHELSTEWGNALTYIDQILANYPHMNSMVLQKARVLCRVARWNEALALVKPFAEPAPGTEVPKELQAAAWQVQVQAYRGMGLNEQLEAVLKRIGGTASTVEIIRYKYGNGDFAGALADANRALADLPDNIDLLILAINIQMSLENKPAALEMLQKAQAKFPDNDRFKMLSVLLTQPEGDPLKTRLVAIDAISDLYTRHMAKSQIYGQMRDRVKQMEELEAAQKAAEESDNPQAKEIVSETSDQIFSLYLTWGEAAGNAAAAAKAQAEGLTDAAAKAKAQKESVDQEAASKKYFEQAEVYVQKAERLNLDGLDGKLYRGRFEFAKGSDSRRVGIQILEQVVAARPSNSIAHTVLGQAYYLMNQGEKGASNDKALEEFRQAIQQKPDNGVALRYAIELLINKADTQSLNEAKEYLKQAMAFTPTDRQLRRFDDVLGDTAESVRVREDLRKKNPEDMENIGRLARLYVKLGQLDQAIELFRVILQKYPDELAVADTIAHLEHEAHHDNNALTLYEKFIASPDPKVSFAALLLLGDMYRLMNNPQEAIRSYHDAIAKEGPNADDAQRRIADLYFDVEDLKNAEAMYREIYTKGGGKDVRVLRRLVECLVREDKFADADTLINSLFAQQPDDPDGWILRGFSLMRQNKAAEAIARFDRVIKAHPDNIDALHYRAFAQYSTQGDLNQAIQDLLVVRGRDPNRVNSRILLAKIYRLTRRFAEAADEYEAVIKLQPDQPAFRTEYAQFLLSVADVLQRLSPENREDFATMVRAVNAESRLTALLRDSSGRFPQQPVWLILEGNLLTLKGMNAEALQRFKLAFETSSGNAQAATWYLAALLKAKNYEEVIKLTTQLMPGAPTYGDYYLKRGDAYAGLKRFPESLADFAQAITLAGKDMDGYLAVVRDAEKVVPGTSLLPFMTERLKAQPEDAEARIGLAEAQLSHAQASGAAETLAPLLADPKFANRAIALRMMGMAKYLSKDIEGSVKAYTELQKLAPGDLEVLNNLAYMLAEDLKRPKDGLIYAEQAVKILQTGRVDTAYVNNGNVYDTLGWVKFLAGDVKGAIAALNQALQIEPIPVAYLHLAKAQKADGNKVQARLNAAEGLRLGKEKKDPVVPELEAIYKELGE